MKETDASFAEFASLLQSGKSMFRYEWTTILNLTWRVHVGTDDQWLGSNDVLHGFNYSLKKPSVFDCTSHVSLWCFQSESLLSLFLAKVKKNLSADFGFLKKKQTYGGPDMTITNIKWKHNRKKYNNKTQLQQKQKHNSK